jgi:hypothetical protein
MLLLRKGGYLVHVQTSDDHPDVARPAGREARERDVPSTPGASATRGVLSILTEPRRDDSPGEAGVTRLLPRCVERLIVLEQHDGELVYRRR